MVQTTPRHCPRCNTPLAENQRICARCGFNLDAVQPGPNASQESYPGQMAPHATYPPRSQQISQHPLPPASQQISQHPLPPASQQISQHPLPPASQQISQHPLPPASQQISQHPEFVQQQQLAQQAGGMRADEMPTQAQPSVNPATPVPLGPQISTVSQHPEVAQADEIPTQAQPTVMPISSPQWGNQQQAQQVAGMPANEIPTQAQPVVNTMPASLSEPQQRSLHPETVQPEQPFSSFSRGAQPPLSLHPEMMYPTGQPAPLQPGQAQPSFHPEVMQQPSPHPETLPPTEQLASPPKKRGKMAALIGGILLVVIVLCAGGYAGYNYFAHRPPVQTPVTTTTIHSTAISYAGVAVTIQSVQRSQIFLDDPKVANDSTDQHTTDVVRVNLQAQNTTTTPVNMLYDKITRLVLPGGKVVNPIYVKAIPAITAGMTQPAKIDFVVPASSKTNQLVLRLGASNEAQLDIPLIANADVSGYGPKTEQMSGQVVYQGLNWSLVNATTQLSIDGQQASSGMHFVTVTLKVDNTLQQPAITGSPFDYLRLKAGNVTASPLDSTLPVMFDQGEKGKTGTVTFMVPQNASSLTLLFQQTGGFDAQTLTFQLS
jgi:hypothetical protein